MEFVLLGLVGLFLIVVAPIWALVGMGKLRRRVDQLERQVTLLSQPEPNPPTVADEPVPASKAVAPGPRTEKTVGPTQSVPWEKATGTQFSAASTNVQRAPDTPPRRFVLTSARMGQLYVWLRENWFIAIAAISLGLAGIFFVQYGIENGILSPRLRVLCAIVFGLILITIGEYIRRLLGDDHDLAVFLPSAFSGAGIVAIFAGIISARLLYELIGPMFAFVGMSITALAAIVLGWFYGPFLIAFGIIGATAAPFLVGGDSQDPWILMYYFALIVAAGLTVDALKRSAWISVLALAIPSGAAWLTWVGTTIGAHHLLAYGAMLAFMSVALPPLSLRPTHGGTSITGSLFSIQLRRWPEFPTRIATSGAIVALGFACLAAPSGTLEFWLALVLIASIFAATVFWLKDAPALDDIALFAGVAALGLSTASGFLNWSATRDWTNHIIPPEGSAPLSVTYLTGLGLALSGLAAYATFTGRHWLWTVAAAALAPAMIVILDLFWSPLVHLDAPTWALHGITVAAALTFAATQCRERLPDTPLPTALFVLAAMTMIAFAAIVLLTKTALTLAFAVLAVSAAWLDRRYDLVPLTLFAKLAALSCSFRLIVDPGVFWAMNTGWIDMLLGYSGTIVLLGAAWILLSPRRRDKTRMVVESVAATLSGVSATVILIRLLDDGSGLENHWGPSLLAIIWLLSAAAQLYRARTGFHRLRTVLAGTFTTLGLLLLGLGVLVFNPVSSFFATNVVGPPMLDSLAAAYLLPAMLFGAVAHHFKELPRIVRLVSVALAGVLAALWVGLEIRRLWRGPDLTQPGVTDPEMYSYTIALIALSAGLLAAALFRRSSLLRKLGLVAAAVAVAKVFLLDAAGLNGLTRVFSFLALGLALAGLAMVNRWIMRLQELDAETTGDDP